MMTKTRTSRTVEGIINSVETLDGEGMVICRPFPKSTFSEFDPFLLLDELGSVDVEPSLASGAPIIPIEASRLSAMYLRGAWSIEIHKDTKGVSCPLWFIRDEYRSRNYSSY